MSKKLLILACLCLSGCHNGTPDWCVAEIRQLKSQQVDDVSEINKLRERVEKLEKQQTRRLGQAADAHAEASPLNIHAALGHALLAAADIAGRGQVNQFFREEVGKIVAHRFPVDLGGAIKGKCQDDMAATINSLMDNP